MKFKHTVPILFSSDILKSLSYYTEVLGFENKWDWGNPPDFGGVSKDSVEVFFCLDGQTQPKAWISIMVDDISEYHEKIKANGAKIISEPKDMPWGLREMLVQDQDENVIRFGQGSQKSDRERNSAELPHSIKIIARVPTSEELLKLSTSVGWAKKEDNMTVPLSATLLAVVAEDTITKTIVGCAFLLGDNAGFYYVRNVMVHPDWQGKRIGSALMQEITDWLDYNAPDNSFVGLHAADRLIPFYRQFGFAPGGGMLRIIRKNEK